ncbi:MAG: DUF4116 domain-containing protein [Chlamydiia bacterium]
MTGIVGPWGSERDPLGWWGSEEVTPKEVRLATHLIAKSYQQLCQSSTSSASLKELLQEMRKSSTGVGVSPEAAEGSAQGGRTRQAAELALRILQMSAAEVAKPYRTSASAGPSEDRPLTNTEILGICDQQDLLDQVVNTSERLLQNVSREVFGTGALRRSPLALQQWALLHVAQASRAIPPLRGSLRELIGTERDGPRVGQLSSKIADTLNNDELLLKEPGIGATELEAQRKTYRGLWTTLQTQVRENQRFKTLGKDLTANEMRTLYAGYVQRLARLWDEYAKLGTPWAFFDLLSRFLQECETGWEGQIALAERTVYGIEPFFVPLETVRDLRRELVRKAAQPYSSTKEGGVEIHYYPALNQMLNETLALGYGAEELGEVELHCQVIASDGARRIAQRRESLPEAEDLVLEKWRGLGEAQAQVLGRLREIYEKALPSIPVEARMLSQEERQAVESYQSRVKEAIAAFKQDPSEGSLRALTSLFKANSIPCSELGTLLIELSTIPPLPSLQGTSASPLVGEGVETFAENLLTRAEGKAFAMALAFPDEGRYHKKGDLTPLGFHLWMAVQGAAEPRDASPEMQAMISGMRDEVLVDAREAALVDAREAALVFVQRGGSLKDLSPRLQEDLEISLIAVARDPEELRYAGPVLRADPEAVFKAVRQNGLLLAVADDMLRNDPRIVQAAVQQNGNALAFASEELQADRTIVLLAVRQEGGALAYADPKWRADRTIVLAAIRQNPTALLFADAALRGNRRFLLDAMRFNGSGPWSGLLLSNASKELRKDRGLLAAARGTVHQGLWSLLLMGGIGLLVARALTRAVDRVIERDNDR